MATKMYEVRIMCETPAEVREVIGWAREHEFAMDYDLCLQDEPCRPAEEDMMSQPDSHWQGTMEMVIHQLRSDLNKLVNRLDALERGDRKSTTETLTRLPGKPTEPGLYWRQRSDGFAEMCSVWDSSGRGLVVETFTSDRELLLSVFPACIWYRVPKPGERSGE